MPASFITVYSVSCQCCSVIVPSGFLLVNYSAETPLSCFVVQKILVPQRVAENLFLHYVLSVLDVRCTHICKYMLTRPFVEVHIDLSKIKNHFAVLFIKIPKYKVSLRHLSFEISLTKYS